MFFGEKTYNTPTPFLYEKDEDIVHAFREKGLFNFAIVSSVVELDSGLVKSCVDSWILPGVRVRIEKTTSLYERTGCKPLV